VEVDEDHHGKDANQDDGVPSWSAPFEGTLYSKSHAKESSTPPFRTAHPRCLDGPKEVEKTETFAVEQRGLGRDVASLRAAIGPTPLRTLCGRSSWHVPQRCMFSLSLAGEEILL
jgi:hypothetical protein